MFLCLFRTKYSSFKVLRQERRPALYANPPGISAGYINQALGIFFCASLLPQYGPPIQIGVERAVALEIDIGEQTHQALFGQVDKAA